MSTTVYAERICKASGITYYDEPGHTITATAQLYRLDGNPRPYFSATATIAKRGRTDAGGCIHDEILAHFPELAPVVRVHLSDDRGVPMHAYANAAYYAGQCWWDPRTQTRPMYPDDNYGRRRLVTDSRGIWAPDVLAEHLRVTVEEAEHLRAETYRIAPKHPEDVDWMVVIDAAGLPARWQVEADAAIACMGGLIRPLPDMVTA